MVSPHIIWTEFAYKNLIEIYEYYKNVAGVSVALKIKNTLFTATKQLLKNPYSGQIENLLSILGNKHRYLVVGNYKIIYTLVEEGVLITDLFDTRQDPKKIIQRQIKQ